MALNPSTNATMTGRITAADGNYPFGSSKDETAPAAGDGTPYFKARADDIFGMQQALLNAASITPSGSAETVVASQYLEAIVALGSGLAQLGTDSGAADVYVVALPSGVLPPDALFDGLTVFFKPTNNNTGASTVNFGGLGVVDIRDENDNALTGGELITTSIAGIRHNIVTGRWELFLHAKSGTKVTTVVSTSSTHTTPAGVKTQKITAVGAGGGSGAVVGSGAGTGASSIAGAGGGTAVHELSGVAVPPSLTIVIPAGGSGGVALGAAASAGGNTTVTGTGVSLTANGGGLGPGRTATAGITLAGAAIGGTATGGNVINLKGGGTTPGGSTGGGGPLTASTGGSSSLGDGGEGGLNATGVSSGVPGAGGGATSVNNISTDFNGAPGGNGRVIIEERF